MFFFLAAIFPFIASGFLFGIYLVILFISKEYISFVLNLYFFLIGIIALYRALHPVLNKIHLPLFNKLRQRQFHLKLSENQSSSNDLINLNVNFNFIDIVTLFFCILIGI